jgi:hypothetical protein
MTLDANQGIMRNPKWVSISLNDNDELFVRIRCIQNIESIVSRKLTVPRVLFSPFRRFRDGLFFMTHVKGCTISLFHPCGEAYLQEIVVPDKKIFITNFKNIIAISRFESLEKKWSFTLSSFLWGKFRYEFIRGPAKIVLCGAGGVHDSILDSTKSKSFNRQSVIGWFNDLEFIPTCSVPLWAAVFNLESFFEFTFTGSGSVYSQTAHKNYFPLTGDKYSSYPIVDYIFALLGVFFP